MQTFTSAVYLVLGLLMFLVGSIMLGRIAFTDTASIPPYEAAEAIVGAIIMSIVGAALLISGSIFLCRPVAGARIGPTLEAVVAILAIAGFGFTIYHLVSEWLPQ